MPRCRGRLRVHALQDLPVQTTDCTAVARALNATSSHHGALKLQHHHTHSWGRMRMHACKHRYTGPCCYRPRAHASQLVPLPESYDARPSHQAPPALRPTVISTTTNAPRCRRPGRAACPATPALACLPACLPGRHVACPATPACLPWPACLPTWAAAAPSSALPQTGPGPSRGRTAPGRALKPSRRPLLCAT